MDSRDDWKPFNNLKGMCRLILAIDWDPIDIFGQPDSLSQYDKYAAEVANMLIARADSQSIRDYLVSVTTKSLEMPVNQQALERVIKKLEHLSRVFA